MSMPRSKAAQVGRETVAILRQGHYTTAAGQQVVIADFLRRAVEGTVGYPPHAVLPPLPACALPTRFTVANETTLQAAARLAAEGFRVVALNFASARHPGGGFLNGARAQEESLCRSSGLYACLEGSSMYAHHAGARGGLYSNYALYSPDVPVLRTDAGELLDEPFLCSFITSPAVNVGAVRQDQAHRIRPEMEKRVHKVLQVAVAHGHEAVVLGAWGCGVFRNDPRLIAELFHAALQGPFRGQLARAHFAVLDGSNDCRTIAPFEQLFAAG